MRTGALLLVLVVLGVGVASAVLLPLAARDVVRADGLTVRVFDPDHVGETSDAWDFLQLARQHLRGQPFTSLFTYVPYLPESMSRRRGDAFPQLWRQPGYPLLLSGAFRAVGRAEPNAVLAVHAVAIVLLPVFAFALARVFLPPIGAAGAAALTVLCPIAVGVGDPLAPTVVFGAALTGLLAAAFRLGTRGWVVVGVGMGVLALTRLETWVIVPGVLVALGWWRRCRWRSLGMILIAVTIAMPWHLHVARSASAMHNHRSLYLHGTGGAEAGWERWEPHRSLTAREVSLVAYTRTHPRSIVSKTAMNGARFARDVATMPAIGVGLVSWAVIAIGVRRRREEAIGVALAALGLIGTIAPLEYGARFVAPLVPALSIACVIGLSRAARRWRGLARGPVVLAGVVVVAALFAVGATRVREPRYPSADAVRELAALDLGDGSDLVSSNVPTLVSWMWDVPTYWWPRPEEAAEVSRIAPAVTVLTTSGHTTEGG